MDRPLTGGIPKSERKEIKKKMLDLVDIYYLALDAPKSGNKVISNPRLICFVLMWELFDWRMRDMYESGGDEIIQEHIEETDEH